MLVQPYKLVQGRVCPLVNETQGRVCPPHRDACAPKRLFNQPGARWTTGLRRHHALAIQVQGKVRNVKRGKCHVRGSVTFNQNWNRKQEDHRRQGEKIINTLKDVLALGIMSVLMDWAEWFKDTPPEIQVG